MPEGRVYKSGLSNSLGTIKFELSNIYATGGPYFPTLNITANIALDPLLEKTQQGNRVIPMSLIRARGKFESPQNRVVGRFDEEILLEVHDNRFSRTTQVVFEIPFDITTIARIEESRAGGDLRVHLNFKLLFAVHAGNGVSAFHSGSVDGLSFEIPRSQWVDKLLPGLGYEGLELIEIRYGPGLIANALPASVKEIQTAKKLLLEAHYDQCAVHCRKAIEVILDSNAASPAPGGRFKDRVNAFISR